MTLEPVSVALKVGFLIVLYLFLLWIARSALKDLRRGVAATELPPDATGMHSAVSGLAPDPLEESEPRLRVEQAMIDRLEALCDAFNENLPELRSFVLPGGTAASAGLHVARTVCRRAEREALVASGTDDVNPLVAVYLNRLSDLLFILARAANALAGVDEPLWKPGASR